MLSKQSRTAPPRLQSQDRPSLDYQAGKKGLTADCLDTSVASEAQGIARQASSVRDFGVCVWEERGGEIAVSWECFRLKRATRYTVREYVIPTAHSSSDWVNKYHRTVHDGARSTQPRMTRSRRETTQEGSCMDAERNRSFFLLHYFGLCLRWIGWIHLLY